MRKPRARASSEILCVTYYTRDAGEKGRGRAYTRVLNALLSMWKFILCDFLSVHACVRACVRALARAVHGFGVRTNEQHSTQKSTHSDGSVHMVVNSRRRRRRRYSAAVRSHNTHRIATAFAAAAAASAASQVRCRVCERNFIWILFS